MTLISSLLNNCKDPPNATGGHELPPDSRNNKPAGQSLSFAKILELENAIKTIKSATVLKEEFVSFLAGEGNWRIPKEDQILIIKFFFEAWFEKAPKEALAAISTIPGSDGGKARFRAFLAGLRFSADMPQAYIEAATTLLPDSEAGYILYNVYTEMFENKPDTWFEFVQTKLGQGRTKQIAITTFFGLQVNQNFRQAVEYARKLTFEEDRRDAFVTIGGPGKLPSQEDLDWALSVGMPKAEVERVRKRMHR